MAPIVAALAAWPLLLVVSNPLLGWSISAGAAAAIPLFFDRLPGWTYPWQVVHLIELLVLIAAVAWTRPLPTVLKVWAVSALLFLIAMPADADAGWSFGVTAIVVGVMLVRGLVLSRRKVAQLEEEGELERARRTVLQERGRIARDLHDVVAHHMSMVVVSAQTAPYRHADVPPRLQAEFETIAATGRQALNEIRGLLGVLRSDNAVAELAPTPTITEVNITVDGVGIEVRNRPASTAPWPTPEPGLGLTGMRERAAAVGGIVAVHADDDEFVVWSYLPAVPATVAECPV